MAKVISMQAALKNIIGYVSNMSKLLPDDEAETLQNEQAEKAVALIGNCKVDPNSMHGDGEEALALLSASDCPWSSDEKAPIIAAIRTKVEGMRKRGSSDQQEINNVEHWYPEWIWNLVKSHCHIDHVFEHCAAFTVNTLKCRNPSEGTRRDIVVLVLCARNITPTREDCVDYVDRVRRQFEAARTVHRNAKGPAVYPSDPSVFATANNLSPKDQPVTSKVTKQALAALKLVVKCRKERISSVTVAPTHRVRVKSLSANLEEQNPVDTLTNFVIGKIKAENLSDLPGVAKLLQHESSSSGSGQPATPLNGDPACGSIVVKTERSLSDASVHAPSAPRPSSAPRPGSLEALRELTRLKFHKMGIDLDAEGHAPATRARARSVKRRPAAGMKRPAACASSSREAETSSSSEEETGSDEGSARTPKRSMKTKRTPKRSVKMKRSESSARPGGSLPKGWRFETKWCEGGKRSYPIWTSPKGKRVRSWTGVLRMVKRNA